jgi:hypothetical protein
VLDRFKKLQSLKKRKLDYNQLSLNPEEWFSLSLIIMSAKILATFTTARKEERTKKATMSIPCLTTSDFLIDLVSTLLKFIILENNFDRVRQEATAKK